MQTAERRDLVGRVVALFQLLQIQLRPVVHRHFLGGAGRVIDGDVLEEGDKAHLLERVVVILYVRVALGRSFMIVERHARRDHVEHDRAAVAERRLEKREQLLLVARE